jgi:hypothetical protein
MIWRRAVGVSLAVVVGAVALAASAGAAPPNGSGPGSGYSAVWQYVEEVPTSGGPTPEEAGGAVAKLPPKVRDQLAKAISAGSASSSTDRVLRKVGTFAAYGAPAAQTTNTTTPVQVVPVKRPAAGQTQHGKTQRIILSGPSPTWFDSRLIILLVAMGLMMTIALASRLGHSEFAVPDMPLTVERDRLDRERRRAERERRRQSG